MTLATVPRYDAERMTDVGHRAVVVGGSVAGLLAARVLADGFEDVMIIERDSLPDQAVARRGVPQGRHIHVLETAGRDTVEDLFPGYGEELISSGGLVVDVMSDFYHYERATISPTAPNAGPRTVLLVRSSSRSSVAGYPVSMEAKSGSVPSFSATSWTMRARPSLE